MKLACFTCLLVLAFTASAETRPFASMLPAGPEDKDSALNAKMPVDPNPNRKPDSNMEAPGAAKLEATKKIKVNAAESFEKENGMPEGIFQRTAEVDIQRVAQLDRDGNRRESEQPPAGAGKQGEENKACPDCPELVAIPGNNFAIGKFAVTFDEWDACVAEGGCGGYEPSDNGWGRGNRPVINVNWNDAQAYAKWLSRKTGKAYRLPSEEEWQIAARAGTTTEYYWGNDVGHKNANCDGCGSEWDNRRTAPVGSFEPNAFGLYDMMGNVWQWTESCRKGNCARRIFCGGSWNHRPQDMRATACNYFDTAKRMRYLGFRVVTTIP